MKLIAIGILATSTGMGITEFLEGPTAIQYGAIAILGASLAYVLCWTIPALLKAFADQRTDFMASSEASNKMALEAAKATRHDFRDSLSNLTRAVESMASATSEARRQGS